MFRTPLIRQLQTSSKQIHCSSTKRIQRNLSQLSRHSQVSSRPVPSIPLFTRRWQSTATEDKNSPIQSGDGASTPTPSAEAQAPPLEDSSKAELEKAKKEIIDLKDKYLRSVADYRNLQDRTQRETTNARQFAIQRFAADLLDSIDNLDRALTSVPETSIKPTSGEPNPDLKNLYNGLKMSDGIMMGTLKKHGIERFDPMEGEGRRFDPNLDEATFFTKVEGKNDGEVFYTQSKGYTLNGRVIRAAKVGVVKNS